MTATEDTWKPLHEWEPQVGEKVVHWKEPGATGTVVSVSRYGHCADPYWRVSIRWGESRVEHGVETSCLTRPDGTQ